VDSNCVVNREFGCPLHSGEQSGFDVVSQFTFTHFASLILLLCVNIDLEILHSLIHVIIVLITRHHVSDLCPQLTFVNIYLERTSPLYELILFEYLVLIGIVENCYI